MSPDLIRPRASLSALASLLWILAPLVGCGDGAASSEPDAGPGGADAADPPDADPGPDPGYRVDLAGRIELVEQVGGGSSVLVELRTGRPPIPEEIVRAEGDCAVYRNPSPGLCEACKDACTPAGECVPFPAPTEAGDLAVTG